MQYHLEQHKLEHSERLKRAEHERLADAARVAQSKPNAALLKLGEALVEAGEMLQESAYRRAPAR